jgi:hypothetical protein
MRRKQPNFPGTAFEDESEPVCLAVVTSRAEAELIVGMLRSGGLRAATSAPGAGGWQPELQLQGIKVLVAPADVAEARECLADIENNPPDVDDTPPDVDDNPPDY